MNGSVLAALLSVLLMGPITLAEMGQFQIMDPGYPLVDGPHPHARMEKAPLDTSRPYIFGHRGDCGEFPEHGAASYLAAINLGADFIECDIVLTKDLKPICRHEPNLSNTTNADELFPDKIKTYNIDGYNSTGVHAIDLTLKQIKELHIRERLYHRSQVYNDVFPVVTLAQYCEMALNAPRTVGIIPETKHPKWHDDLLNERGHKTTITDITLNILKRKGYDNEVNTEEWLSKPAALQSFEVNNLKDAAGKTMMPLVQLMDENSAVVADGSYPTYGDMMTDEALADIATYAYSISPWKETLVRVTGDVVESSGLLERAKAHGLAVHTYTFRNEPWYHTKTLDTIEKELDYYFGTLGVDGGFFDMPGTAAQYFRNKAAEN